jgi:hypothetical protein
LRRHAPRPVKIGIAAGTGVFAVMSFVLPLVGQPGLWALLAFQVAGLGLAGALVLTRDRASLSAGENMAAVRLAISLVLIIPLAALDFIVPLTGLAIQPSGLAVLFLCWLAIGLGRPGEGHSRSLEGFGVVLTAALLLTGFLTFAIPLGARDALIVGAATLSVMLVPAIWRDVLEQGDALRERSLLRHIAGASGSASAFLNSLRGHPLIEGALWLEESDLRELDLARLRAILADRPVLRRRDIGLEGDAADYAAHLFERFDASHILWIGEGPLRLLALSLPDLSASSRAEIEVDAVQRVARLLAEGR